MHKNRPLPKVILLSLGIIMMLPIASSWQNMFGSVGKAIGGYQIMEEEARMEEEMTKMQQQVEKLTALIEQLEQRAVSE